MVVLLLKPRNVTDDGVIAGATLHRVHLHGHGNFPDVRTGVAGGIDQGFDQNLALEIV